MNFTYLKKYRASFTSLLNIQAYLILLTAGLASSVSAQGAGNGWIPDSVSLSHAFFLGAHNAPFSKDRGWQYAQQQSTITKQLENGVRWMKAPLRYYLRWNHLTQMAKEPPFLVLSHEAGIFKSMNSLTSHFQKATLSNPTDRALDFMKEINDFLQSHPTEILVLVLETHNMIPSDQTHTQNKTAEEMKSDIRDLFTKSGLSQFAYKLHVPENGLYPTFGDLKHSGKRLIVFSSNHTYDLDTEYTNSTKLYSESDYLQYDENQTDLRTKNADTKGRGLDKFFLMNNFDQASLWPNDFYHKINSFEYLAKRFSNFRARRPRTSEERAYIPADGYLPNAVLLDWVEIGDGQLFSEAVNLEYIKEFYPDLITEAMRTRSGVIGKKRMSLISKPTLQPPFDPNTLLHQECVDAGND